MRCLLFILFLLVSVHSYGKNERELMKAKFYYSHMAYQKAIPYFEQIVDEYKDAVLYGQLANCYYATNNLPMAEATFKKAIEIKDCKPEVVFDYARLLMQLARYADALKWFDVYQAANKGDRRVTSMMASCNYAIKQLTNVPEGTVTLSKFNTDGSDFAPTIWRHMLVFSSDTDVNVKKKKDNWSGRAFYNIYATECDSVGNCGSGFIPAGLPTQANIKYHTGPCTFSADGKQMLFTRTRYEQKFLKKGAVESKDSSVGLEIMIASGIDTVTNSFREIAPFQYNNTDYSTAYAAVSPNGRTLAFCSDMPKGKGGMDIYICKKTGNKWGKPQNAADVINTAGTEAFPYWLNDTTLFFSSDYHEGFGGMDIFKVHFNEKQTSFDHVENVGYPINSSYDETTLAPLTERGMYFSSNRPSEKASDNVFFFRKHRIFLKLKVIDSITRQPLANIKVALKKGSEASVFTSDDAGEILTRLNPDEYTEAQLNEPLYKQKMVGIIPQYTKPVDTLTKVVELVKNSEEIAQLKLSVELPVKHKNVMDPPGIRQFNLDEIYEVGHFYFDYNKYDLTVVHKRFLDTLLVQLNRHPTMRMEIRAHTDCRGTDASNKILSNNRALSVVSYLIKHGIKSHRLEYVGLGSSMPFIKMSGLQFLQRRRALSESNT